MNNVMQLVKHNLLKLVIAILIAVGFALSAVGHAQSTVTSSKPMSSIESPDPDSGSSSNDINKLSKSGSGWGG